MSDFIRLVERLFWLIVWVFLALILGNYLLHWLKNIGDSGPIGNFSSWVSNHAAVS